MAKHELTKIDAPQPESPKPRDPLAELDAKLAEHRASRPKPTASGDDKAAWLRKHDGLIQERHRLACRR